MADSAGNTSAVASRFMLAMMLLLASALFADVVVGLRSPDVGTDTHNYAMYFLASRHAIAPTRFEPGFVLLTRVLSATGMSVAAYQMCLFAVLLLGAYVAARRYSEYLGMDRGFSAFLLSTLMLLLLSPMFVNASINAVRQGMSAPWVFAALLCFHQRRWRHFVLYGAVATSIHYSAALYLLFAPVLLLKDRWLRLAAVVAFVVYCSGASMAVVRSAVPSVYNAVMEYDLSANFKSGVRIDFAVFATALYALPLLLSRVIQHHYAERIKQSTSVYLVMLLPFFAVGWGNFSNRYLLPAYVAVSLIGAAVMVKSRLSFLRQPLVLGGGLAVACVVFFFFVTHQVVI